MENQKQPQKPELSSIAAWLKKVKFRKKLFGGVDEADVWKKLDELNRMYEQLHEEERIRYDALLEERVKEYQQHVREKLAQKFSSKEGR